MRIAAWIVLVAGLGLVARSASAQGDSGSRAGRAGQLVLEGDHPGAEVYVDAERVGTLPLAPIELSPGNHTIRVVQPGYTEYADVFRIRARRETLVQVELLPVSMALDVATDPSGAQVFVDEDFVGLSPLQVDLLEGTHTLAVELRGYHRVTRDVDANAGGTDSVRITLTELPDEKRQAMFEPDDPSWYEEPLPWILIGGGAAVVAAGVVALVMLTNDDPSQVDEWCQGGGAFCPFSVTP